MLIFLFHRLKKKKPHPILGCVCANIFLRGIKQGPLGHNPFYSLGSCFSPFHLFEVTKWEWPQSRPATCQHSAFHLRIKLKCSLLLLCSCCFSPRTCSSHYHLATWDFFQFNPSLVFLHTNMEWVLSQGGAGLSSKENSKQAKTDFNGEDSSSSFISSKNMYFYV